MKVTIDNEVIYQAQIQSLSGYAPIDGVSATVLSSDPSDVANGAVGFATVIGKAGTFKNLRIATEDPSTGSTSVTLCVNGSASSLVATVPAGNTQGTDSTHPVHVDAGDLVAFYGEQNGGSASNDIATYMEFIPD